MKRNFNMLRTLTAPKNPEEAIASRRNPCYGFAILADIQEQKELISILTETRDKILEIIDPDRATKKRPIRSPLYIKQKFFHAAVFGMPPLLEEKQFIEIFANENGLLNNNAMDKMCDVLSSHLQEEKPFLEPVKCEMMNNDGTILARFAYKTLKQDDAPLLALARQLDPEKKFSTWDPANQLRYMTVAVVICVIDYHKMTHHMNTIQKQLEISSVQLKKLGNIDVNHFQFINRHDKRTLSLKHTSMYASVNPNGKNTNFEQIPTLFFKTREIIHNSTKLPICLSDIISEYYDPDLSSLTQNLRSLVNEFDRWMKTNIDNKWDKSLLDDYNKAVINFFTRGNIDNINNYEDFCLF